MSQAEAEFELVELHDADVDRVVLSSSDIVIELTNIVVCRREGDGGQGCWLHRGQVVASNVYDIAMTSRGGLAMEADSLYAATFVVHGKDVDPIALLEGASDCLCTFEWAISGTSFRFHAKVVRLAIEANGERLASWDPETRTMHR